MKLFMTDPDFEQDLRALFMAFYPLEPIRVITEKITYMTRTPEGGLPAMPDTEPETVFCYEPGHMALFRPGRETLEAVYEEPFVPEKGGPQWEKTSPQRLERKNEVKRQCYALCAEDTGKQLPWGTLTGIRPVKLAMAGLLAGETRQETCDRLSGAYRISHEKLKLALDIARRERELTDAMDCGRGWSLYAGIPFCPTTCAYCSFTSFPLEKWKEQVDRYLDCVIKELEFLGRQIHGRRLNTIYIGGGTPTTLEPGQMERLLDAIVRCLPTEDVREWTVEAGRPDSITREKLQVLKRYPVTRISINPQTMKEETLRLIGRRHTVEQTREAFALARDMGFDNINMDLIMGLPGETAEDVARTMEEIETLGPDSLTVHSLAVKRAARLNTHREEFAGRGVFDTEAMIELAAAGAARMDMRPYYLYRQKNMAGNFENVGYAKEGKYGLYNILIMEELQPIIAVGAGGATKAKLPDGNMGRVENVKNVAQYMDRIDEMIERKAGLMEQIFSQKEGAQ